jgi:hypothetical protein
MDVCNMPGRYGTLYINSINKLMSVNSIADPDPTIAPSRIQIPDPGGKKAPDPGSDLFLYKGY